LSLCTGKLAFIGPVAGIRSGTAGDKPVHTAPYVAETKENASFQEFREKKENPATGGIARTPQTMNPTE